MAKIASYQYESEVLRRLVGLLMAPRSPVPLEQTLDPALHRAARAAYFLLDPGGRVNVETFVTYTLTRLLHQLNCNAEPQQVTYRGRVRGRIVWPATFKARHGSDYDPSRFVCREVRRLYDTPENMLLKYMIERIEQCLRVVPEPLHIGERYFPAATDRQSSVTATAALLETIETAIRNFRRNIYLREIVAPQTITEFHLLRAETARIEEYADLARLYRRYQAVVASSAWDELAQIGKRVLPLPRRTGLDGDQWIRFGAAVLRY
ncbi:MAG: hypothetical protein MOB07_03895 [Acidobacteria bacterium]|nr:hypothetical protein [Acidobacteriota bacterium]